MGFDSFSLLLLAIAVIVFWRLRSVLGTRTGNERPPFDPFGNAKSKDPAARPDPANGNVLRFPRDDQSEGGVKPPDEPTDRPPVWTGYATPDSDAARGLEQIAQADPSFAPKTFLEGAKLAYEMVIDSFAKGDKAALKPLLAKDVYDGFAAAIDQRQSDGYSVEQRFVGIEKTAITSAEMNGRKASVTVNFVSDLISVTHDRGGTIVDGDPKQIREITDVWTFERDTSSRDPNWKLVATQEPA